MPQKPNEAYYFWLNKIYLFPLGSWAAFTIKHPILKLNENCFGRGIISDKTLCSSCVIGCLCSALTVELPSSEIFRMMKSVVVILVFKLPYKQHTIQEIRAGLVCWGSPKSQPNPASARCCSQQYSHSAPPRWLHPEPFYH